MSTDEDTSIVSRSVSASGLRINVRIEGEGEPLLVINGLTRPLDSWAPFARAMSGCRIVSFDAPGVGESPNSLLPMSIAQLADLCVTVLDELELESVDVLGFSHGGAVAQELAASHPTRVRRLVLAATSCGFGSSFIGWDVRESVSILMNGLFRVNALSTLWRVMAIASWSSIPFLGTIAAPTLVVCGRQDRVTPVGNSRTLAERIPNATLIELSEGHDLQEPGAAEELARVVEEFLVRDPRTEDCFTL
ncbi:MAG: alpha/beta fold hydrolase [Acidimicrobiales bacterium]